MVEDDELRGMFWADSIAKRNYKEFSDIVSFDATFRTNKYNLVFVPFTGIDNHKKSVIFGAGLLAKETAEYYIWLLKCFLESFGKQPFIVVTDQDAAISKAVETVFNQSIHRLCMWHIGKKLSDKVSSKVLRETDFCKRLQRLIWNCCIDPDEFESTWISIIEEFELEENNWLNDMFSIRSRWIPAFFKDMSLSGLMKTTSRSESENFFFQGFMSKTSNLLSFMMKFDAAMDMQRNIQLSNDFYCKNKSPVLETCLPFEVQASKFYTRTIFGIVQNELHDSLYFCSPGLFTIIDDHEVCSVIEQPLGKYGKNQSTFFKQILRFDWDLNISEYEFKVNVYDNNETFKCSCMVFEHFGILCRHIFCIMKRKCMKEIPVKYLLRRWEKDIIHPEDLKNTSVGDNTGGCEKIVHDLYSIVAECISLVSHDSEALQEYVKWQKEMKEKIEQNPPKEDTRTKSELFDALIGVSKPAVNEIRNPQNVRNKGCGFGGKRLKSQKEIALTEGKHCTFCNKLVLPSEKHDRRNCPLRKEKELEEQLKKQKDLENGMDD